MKLRSIARKMREVPFLPSGIGLLEFRLLDLILGQFSSRQNMDFPKHGQKDAQGTVSPLRVHTIGVCPANFDFEAFLTARKRKNNGSMPVGSTSLAINPDGVHPNLLSPDSARRSSAFLCSEADSGQRH